MTEEKNNNIEGAGSCCMFCKGGKMMHGHNGMHKGCHVIRWILGILILWVVFMGGIKLGELKSFFYGSESWSGHMSRKCNSNFDSSLMNGSRYQNRPRNNQNQIYFQGPKMMNQQQIQEVPVQQNQ